MRNLFFAILLVLLLGCTSLAQTSDNSVPLGDAAKKCEAAKKDKDASAKAKKVFTDEDMSARRGPIPSIALQGPENTEEILNAIHEFRANHDPASTEEAVHKWFDQETATLSDAIDASTRMQKHNQLRAENAQDTNSYPRYNYPQDYDSSRYRESMTSQVWSQRIETRTSQENVQIIARVQQVMMKVRVDVYCRPYKTRPAAYDWFKIRTANGVNAY